MSADGGRRGDRRQTTVVVSPGPIAPRQRRATLLGVSGSVLGQKMIVEGAISAGRAPEGGLVLSGVGVSAVHARFEMRDDLLWVEDQGSTNGTWVNGLRIDGPTRLNNDDLIQIGTESFRFRWADDVEVALYEQLVREATRDPLTGLRNRRHFFSELERDLGRAVRARRTLSVLFVDIDSFKAVNDQHGHAAGDDVLREVARRIEATIRTTDVAARYGGEEFVVMLPDTMLMDAHQVAERVRHVVKETPVSVPGLTKHVTVSIGVAELAEVQPPPRLETPEQTNEVITALLNLADRRLYEAKSSGRDRVKGWG
jgi:two-component system cell cycle response regulator